MSASDFEGAIITDVRSVDIDGHQVVWLTLSNGKVLELVDPTLDEYPERVLTGRQWKVRGA